MYKIIYAALSIFWVLDVCNIPFMEIFDTSFPINTLAWLLIWIMIPETETVVKHLDRDGE